MSEATSNLQEADGSAQMFSRIAGRYDLLNSIMSLGLHQRWRRLLVNALNLDPSQDAPILDLATGTGDVAIAIAKKHPKASVVALDPCLPMLEIAKEKIAAAKLGERIQVVEGDAQNLPFEDNHFAGCSISFGIRNVPDRSKAIAEMARVTKPGGIVAILELAEPGAGLINAPARFHVHTIVPWLGALLSGVSEYRYLQKSIAAFPPAAEFAKTMEQAGLSQVSFKPLTFGAVTLYTGRA